MAKKSKVNARLKKKEAKPKPLNPFEIRHKKSKQRVVGVKERTIGGVPGISRSRAIEKRKETLGVEYKKRMKKNKFVDERFGAHDTNLTPEEKMLKRFTLERQRKHGKQSVFNLDDEDQLTHKGIAIDHLDDFDDLNDSDISDVDEKVENSTTDLHFGGFLTKNEGEKTHEKSGKEIMEDIVAKSKLEKLERQRTREANSEITNELDNDWTALHTMILKTSKPFAKAEKKPVDIEYDQAITELAFEAKAAPTDKLKTEEEIAREAREELERLEKERIQRMSGTAETTRADKSADALVKLTSKCKPSKVLVSYDKETGKMNKNEEFNSALESLKNKNAENTDSDEEDDGESIEDEDESEEEDEEEDEEEEGVNADESDENQSEDDITDDAELPAFTSNDIEDGDNCAFDDDIVEDSDHEDENESKNSENEASNNDVIPFIIDTPEHMKDFRSLISGYDQSDTLTIIKRIIASNHPSLSDENKTKTSSFYIILIKYLTSLYEENLLEKDLLDGTVSQLYSVTKFISRQVYEHMFGVVSTLKHLIEKNIGKSIHQVFKPRYIIYLYLIQRIYPVSDFKHAIVTPIFLSLAWVLGSDGVRKPADIKVGLFLCNFILQATKSSGRYVPEVIYFLTQVLNRGAGHKSEYVGNFRFKPDIVSGGRDAAPGSNPLSSRPSKLSLRGLYDNTCSTPTDLLFGLLSTLSLAMKQYHDFTAFNAVFREARQAVVTIVPVTSQGCPKHQYHTDIVNISRSISSQYEQFSRKLLPYLRYKDTKPPAIKMYEPKFDLVYMERQRKDKDETRILKKKVKEEMKGAVREIRKDNRFMSRMKHREQVAKDSARKRKVNEIMGFLSKEQGEANDLKWKKKRGKA